MIKYDDLTDYEKEMHDLFFEKYVFYAKDEKSKEYKEGVQSLGLDPEDPETKYDVVIIIEGKPDKSNGYTTYQRYQQYIKMIRQFEERHQKENTG